MSLTNNSINTPDLKTAGNLLIGTGTIPIVGPLLGFGKITVTPVGTAISISGGNGSGLVNFMQSFVWGAEFQDQIPCASTTFFASVVSGVEGSLGQISTYWFQLDGGKQFIISVWDYAGNTKLAETPIFTPSASNITDGLYVTVSFSSPFIAQPATLYWIELRPVNNAGNAQVYGQQNVATNDADFNRLDVSQGTVSISPQGKSASSQRVWYYLES